MRVSEQACVFHCAGERLVGVLHAPPSSAATLGVLIVVGGPQYRIGSHRQFLLLARTWAEAGIPVFRFDCRGMGDSSGEFPGFEQTGPDIAAAVDAFFAQMPALQRVALWGLCDGATAISGYACRDRRVAGIALMNPWVRSEAGQARTQLKHYYLQRLTDPDFRRKLMRGQLRLGRSLRDVAANVAKAFLGRPRGGSHGSDGPTDTLIERMGAGVLRYGGPVLLLLSGEDLTGKEFADAATASPRWRRIFAEQQVRRHELPLADHTFSRRAWRDQVALWTRDWLAGLDRG
ncbi:MAG TPA: hydrolase 1, exosortase A system-associated [Stellaceae bacterium]|nr:hydrolase 1, exosortase A system-associated [Stellaceae bacterium]